nr:hypothetical protein [uncultured Cupriavidus sp.]
MRLFVKRWMGAGAILLLVACTILQPVQTAHTMIGLPQSAVRDAFGVPMETYQLANGDSRWIYSKQPFGYFVYAADFDGASNLKSFRQMLTEKEIGEARPGVWTKRDVAERFGMPREPVQYYSRMKREAWSYRMYADGHLPAHFSTYFDDQGILERTMIIVDLLGGDNDRSK